ncbi:MAG: hypothetical protein ACK2U1_19895, partial [Anaerolineales bacterium]
KMVYRGKLLFYQKHYGKFRTAALRALLGGMSLAKMLFWSVFGVFPKQRDRAVKELQSNLDVVKLCIRLE